MSAKSRDREKFVARQEAERKRLNLLWATQRATGKQVRRAMALDRKFRHASREEQYGTYLDCGPLAWDDHD